MRSFSPFAIDGKPMLAPDKDLPVGFEDIDASDSGRDESAVMQRNVIRHNVGNWQIAYSFLTDEEMRYTRDLLWGKDNFQFTYPVPGEVNTTRTVTAYCSKKSLAYNNLKQGLWKNVSFKIVEC